MHKKTYTRAMVGQRSAAQIQHAVRSTVMCSRDGQEVTLGAYSTGLKNDGLAWALQESIKKLIAAHKYGTNASIGKEREMLQAVLGATVMTNGLLMDGEIPDAVQRIDQNIIEAIGQNTSHQTGQLQDHRGRQR
jgi:hypothetical protein